MSMRSYHLQIVTPDGARFDGQAEKLLVRTIAGDVCILAGHINYVTAVGMGVARVGVDGETRRAACIGGMLTVHEGEVRLVASTFEWAADIDVERARRAEEESRTILDNPQGRTEEELQQAQSRLHRAQVRLSAAET